MQPGGDNIAPMFYFSGWLLPPSPKSTASEPTKSQAPTEAFNYPRGKWILLSENVYFVWLKASEESSAASTPRNSSEIMGRGEEAREGRMEALEYLRVRSHQT